jgi:ABC-type Fe3+ transport system substrate-binding protein
MRAVWRASVGLLAWLTVACAPSASAPGPGAEAARPAGTAAPAASSAPTAAAGTAASSAGPAGGPASPTEWQQLEQAARREGTVVVAGRGFPGLRSAVVDGFQRAHGIAVEYVGLAPGEVLTRVDRDARAGITSIDVNLGGTPTCWLPAERGYVQDVLPLLVDPEVVNPAAWRGGALRLIRPAPSLPNDFHCGLQTAEWVMTDLFVNRELVAPSALTSWRDLLKPEYAGKIAAFDPRQSGPGQTTIGYLSALFGERYVRDLYLGQRVTLTADSRQLAEWVARGSYPIGIALVQPAVEPLRTEGLPLERVFPADGPGALTGGSGAIYVTRGAAHPNAAALFVNWFASREAQEAYEAAMMETSLRTDVSHQVPDYVIPKTGVTYQIDDYDPDYFYAQRAPAISRMQELLGR